MDASSARIPHFSAAGEHPYGRGGKHPASRIRSSLMPARLLVPASCKGLLAPSAASSVSGFDSGMSGCLCSSSPAGPTVWGFTWRVKESNYIPSWWGNSTKKEALRAVVLERADRGMCQHPFLSSVGMGLPRATDEEDVVCSCVRQVQQKWI